MSKEFTYEELISLSETLKGYQPHSMVERYAYGWKIWEAADRLRDLAEKHFKE